MLRRFLLPLLGVAFFTTEAASAQTTPAGPAPAKQPAGTYAHAAPRSRVLTAREKRAAEKAARAAAVATPAPTSTAATAWSGWSNEPMPPADNGAPHRPTTNLSVAPGMPINQVGHGVTTDYNGRPLHHEVASTTLSPAR